MGGDKVLQNRKRMSRRKSRTTRRKRRCGRRTIRRRRRKETQVDVRRTRERGETGIGWERECRTREAILQQ
jgi:hypothetical protein